MADSPQDVLAQQYRQQLIDREEIARRSILKNYRGVWRGLGEQIDGVLGSLRADPVTNEEIKQQFADEIATAAAGNTSPEVSPDKLGKVADLLMKKSAWQQVESKLDLSFEDIAGKAAELTAAHGTDLGKTAVADALKQISTELKEQNAKFDEKDQTKVISETKIAEIEETVRDFVTRSWQANQLAIKDSFIVKAAEAANAAREALRREVMLGLLKGVSVSAKEILGRVNLTIDQRENDPASDPALVRALRSEYRINVVESYRQSVRLTYELSGKVKKWQWTSSRTARTCAICWGYDGKTFNVATTPISHPHCRCVLVPVTDDESAPKKTQKPQQPDKSKSNGAAAFSNIPIPQQRAILGARAFEAYQNGEFELTDLIGIQYNQRFGVILYRRSVDQAIQNAHDRQKAEKKDEAKYLDPAQLMDAPLTVGGKKLRPKDKVPRVKVETSAYTIVDDGPSQIKTGEMSVERFWEVKKGFATGSITIPVSVAFLKTNSEVSPALLYHYALDTLKAQFYFKQEAIDRLKAEAGDTPLFYIGGDKNKEALTIESLKEDMKTDKYLNVIFKPATLQKLYRYGLEAGGDEQSQQLLQKLDYDIAKRERLAELEKQRPQNNPVGEMFWAMHRDIAMKEFIRQWEEDHTIGDPRDPNNKDANALADTIENFFRQAIETNPLYRFLPDSVKKEMVKFSMGGVNGAISLTSSVAGIGAFLQDSTLDLFISGMRDLKLADKIPGFEKLVQQNLQQREDRKAFFAKYATLNTADMQVQVNAYNKIVAEGLPTVPYDTPNFSAAAGSFVVQALPFIALTAATAGVGGVGVGGLILEGAIQAGTQGAISLGGTYISSNNYKQALISGGLATVQGALGGVTNRLPLAANLASDALSTYVFGKISGQDDDEIFRQIIFQTGFAGAMKTKDGFQKLSEKSFRPGGEMNEALAKLSGKDGEPISFDQAKQKFLDILSENSVRSSMDLAAQVRQVVQTTEVVRQINREIASAKNNNQKPAVKAAVKAANTGVKPNAAKMIAEYGSQNRFMSSAEATATRQELAKKVAGATAPNKGELAVPMTKLAVFHLESGIRTFGDFVKMMQAELKGSKLSLDEYEQIYKKGVDEVNRLRKENPGKTAAENETIKADLDSVTRFKEALRKTAEAEAAKKEQLANEKKKAASKKAANKETGGKTSGKTSGKKPVKPTDDANPKETGKKTDQPASEKKTSQKKEKAQLTEEEQARADADKYANYDDVKKMIGQELDINALKQKGYTIRYRNEKLEIVRLSGNRKKNYAKLTLDGESRLMIDRGDSPRISDPTKMKNNFKDKLAEELFGPNTKLTKEQKKAIKDIVAKIEHHHMISDGIVRNTDLGKLAQRAQYDLDKADNQIGLVNDKSLIGKKDTFNGKGGELLDFNTGHWDYHPKYDKMVRERMKAGLDEIKKEFPGIDVDKILADPSKPLPKELKNRILNEMKKIELELREKIRKGDVPRDEDGRLAELWGIDRGGGDTSA